MQKPKRGSPEDKKEERRVDDNHPQGEENRKNPTEQGQAVATKTLRESRPDRKRTPPARMVDEQEQHRAKFNRLTTLTLLIHP